MALLAIIANSVDASNLAGTAAATGALGSGRVGVVVAVLDMLGGVAGCDAADGDDDDGVGDGATNVGVEDAGCFVGEAGAATLLAAVFVVASTAVVAGFVAAVSDVTATRYR